MKKNSFPLNILYLFITCLALFQLGSCTVAKNVVYFQNLQKDTNLPAIADENFEVKIRKNDLLYIGIMSADPAGTILFNSQASTVSPSSEGGSGTSNTGGYLVDNNGNITLYKLGSIHVEGLTREELKVKLQKELAPYLLGAVITVRFLNNHITVLGEVAHPQVITMPTEKLTLLEALGMSGDITITGRKDNILLIRETPAGKQLKRLNLTDKSIFNSPFYYLMPDDVVYVEPTDTKIKNSGNTPQLIGYILTAVSIAITLLLNIKR